MANEAGQGCVDRGGNAAGYTWVSKGHPASITGNCVKMEVNADAGASTNDVHFAFFSASGNNLTSETGTVNVGDIGGTVQACYSFDGGGDAFTTFGVTSGWYIGSAAGEGSVSPGYSTSGGDGLWYEEGAQTATPGIGFSAANNGHDQHHFS